MSRELHADSIVVGGGSAGCELARPLTEDRDTTVLVLEAGGWDHDPLLHVPLGHGKLLADRRLDRMYMTEPVSGLDERVLRCERGKVIGGSYSTNAMVYVRGHRGDYDRWADAGLPLWSYQHVLSYFRRAENWESDIDAYWVSGGPLATTLSPYDDPLVQFSFDAAASAGFPSTSD